jgi:hypothetical protein
MRFIDILLENSDLREAKLYQAAHKAFKKPDTGITIQHKGAYNVIRDCANITIKYLPHFIFGAYSNPFDILNGKFKRPEIEEFVQKSRDDCALNHLRLIIINKYESLNKNTTSSSKTQKTFGDFLPQEDVDDPYGLYGEIEQEEVFVETEVKLSDVDLLCLAFGV